MLADWVGASVRARSMAQRRVGAGGSHRIAAQRSFADGISLLSGTTYGDREIDCVSRSTAEHTIRATVLWQLRVLAGWIPGTGTRLIRAAAAAYERDNILTLARSIVSGEPAPEFFDLGALATAWPRLRAAQTAAELTGFLQRSPWGDPGAGNATALRDILTVIWWGRLAAVAAPARPWAAADSALIVARMLLVDRSEPSARFRQAVRPLLGTAWESARSLPELRAALPRSTQGVLRGVDDHEDLWRSEARLRANVEADGFRLLRSSQPGPDAVLGCIAVLEIDAWRVRAALAAAAVGVGSSEVLDAMV